MAHIHKMIEINAPIEDVYSFARTPESWSDWWVGLQPAITIDGSGEVGTIVRHEYKMAGIPFHVTSRVLVDSLGPLEGRWKGEFKGLLTGTLEWKYKALGDRTEVTVDIDYTVPGKAIGKFADRMLVERMEERAIETTIDNLRMLVEAGVTAPALA